jgi:hypothetical protein
MFFTNLSVFGACRNSCTHNAVSMQFAVCGYVCVDDLMYLCTRRYCVYMPTTNIFSFVLIVRKALQSRKCSSTSWLVQPVPGHCPGHEPSRQKQSISFMCMQNNMHARCCVNLDCCLYLCIYTDTLMYLSTRRYTVYNMWPPQIYFHFF